MKANYQNILTSSFLLFLDNQILKKGEAFSNVSSLFYPITCLYSGYCTYAAPYKQIINDTSISGANQFTGVYVDGTFTVPGQNNLVAISHYDGQLIFSTDQMGKTLSGNYAIKDFNIYLTDKSEESILFTTKIEPKSRKGIESRGLDVNEITYPAVFLRLDASTNEPFAFGGVDMTNTTFRTIIMSNSMFSLDAVCGILRDTSHNFFRLVDNNSLNLNAMNGYTGVSFNYANAAATGEPTYIADVRVARVKPISSPDFVNLNPEVFSAIVDFEIESVRNPHVY